MVLTEKPTTEEMKLNKTERAWLDVLRSRGVIDIGVQNMTLKLADDCRYTPDFCGIVNQRLVFWEVKGFMRDDALVKLKVATRLFRRFDFILVQRIKGQWIEREVKA